MASAGMACTVLVSTGMATVLLASAIMPIREFGKPPSKLIRNRPTQPIQPARPPASRAPSQKRYTNMCNKMHNGKAEGHRWPLTCAQCLCSFLCRCLRNTGLHSGLCARRQTRPLFCVPHMCTHACTHVCRHVHTRVYMHNVHTCLSTGLHTWRFPS